MEPKILILGKGYIASRLMEEFKAELSDKKIYSFREAEKEIKKIKPDILINCVGYIGRNVDECELDKDKALTANVFVPIILAEAALRNNIKLVHISSGCIYHYDYKDQGPIGEEDIPDFFELFYSRTKIYPERALNILADKYNILIPRIRIPLDNRPHPKNLIDKLVAYKKVIDLPNSVTYIPDFIRALKYLIGIDAKGIYNVVNSGGLKYPELMEVYRKYASDFKYEVVKAENLKLVRTNLILSTEKLEKSGFKVRDIHEVLEECVRDYLKY